MKRKSLLFLLLMALFAPLAMNGQTTNQLLSENFDSMSSLSTSYSGTDWFAYNAGNGNNWSLNSSSSYAHSGSQSAQVQYNSSYAANCYLVSAPFTTSPNMTEISVSLYERARSSSYQETFEVFFVKASDVTSAASVTSATQYNAISSQDYTNTTYAEVTGSYTSSALAGQSLRVVVHCTSIADRFYLNIDDITVTETLEEACPKPTGLTASNVTTNSATLNWNGEAESYNVRYRGPKGFHYDFESAEPWTITNFSPCTVYDGDQALCYGFDGETFTNIPFTGSTIAFQSQDGNLSSHNGNAFGMMISAIPDEYPDGITHSVDWFILPEITIANGDVFSFWGREITTQYGDETINVGIYGNTAGSFTATIAGNVAVNSTEWTEFSYDLSAYAGQTIKLAINYVSDDIFGFMFDDIFVGNPNDNTWDEVITDVTSPLTITGLTADTDYEFQVQADCGTDGESGWSASATFHTLDACAIPYELSTTNITAASATLNWTGAQEAYNVRYRSYTLGEPQENVFEEGFEGGSMPTGWTTTGSYWQITSGTGNSSYTGSATGSYNAGCFIDSFSGSDILITPAIDLSQATSATLTFNFWNTSWGGDINTLNVYYRVDGGNWSNALYTNNSQVTPWTSISVSLPSSGFAANYQIGFECVSNYSYGMGIDDVKITYTAQSINYGEWVTKTNVTNPLTITGLTPETDYEWQVQGVDCDGNGGTTDWSAPATFSTLEGYTKTIEAYGTSERGGYYLIASPVGTVTPSADNGFLRGTYDLYYFDQNAWDMVDNENVLHEWRNYDVENFSIASGTGYLYANKEGTTLTFTGTPYSGNGEVSLSKTEGPRFSGWNLVGNPFAQTAYFTNDFYTLNEDRDEVVAGITKSVEAMEGIFVVAKSDGETMTFSTTPLGKSNSQMSINVVRNRGNVIDRAIVRFDEESLLPKFQLNPNHTKVYIPQDGSDYAVVYADGAGTMPVNFKAEKNGHYTLNFTTENVNFNYLHLIDNMNGNDVDLLQTPYYAFDAKSTDFASRFTLVFATGNDNDGNFAFFNNGVWIINNDGKAELQVVDALGRILSSETISGSCSKAINAAPGVYMLRLINGNDVKVQKVVVR